MTNIHSYNLRDLEEWSKRIEEIVAVLGMDFYPQEYEIINYKTMMEREVYGGMLSFYPNWPAGKRYEINSTFFGLGAKALPYELVIASNPCLACLMNDNDLAMQILTMAHVYGHNNFFKNNIYFQKYTDAATIFDFFKSSSERIRSYEQNPLIGPTAVRKCLDAAHALMYCCSETSGEQDLLIFLRNNSPRHILDWERDIIDIVSQTFSRMIKPHMLTIGANEGWAVYCHYKIMRALNLPASLYMAYARHHSKVVRMPDDPTQYNQYFVNFSIWNSIEREILGQEGNPSKVKPIPKELFEIMRSVNDIEFLQKYLTKEIAQEVGLMLLAIIKDKNIIVDKKIEQQFSVHDEDKVLGEIKEKLTLNMGFNSIPNIRVADANYEGHNYLYLKHNFNGRWLESEYTSKTLEHIFYFWPRKIILETRTYKRQLPYIYTYDGQRSVRHRKR